MKALKNLFLLWIVTLTLLSFAKADILPEDSHSFKRCVQIENPNEIEWFNLIIRIHTVVWNNKVYQVENDTCLKWHYHAWYSVPYLIQQDINIEKLNSMAEEIGEDQNKFESHLWDIFTRFDTVNPNGWYISNNSEKTYEKITYKLKTSNNTYKLTITEQDHDWEEDSDLPNTLMWYTTNLSNPNGEEPEEPEDPEDPNEILENWYTREMNNAYEFAYDNWITTMSNINQANMDWNLNRIAMAKMLSQYAINILNKNPDTSKNCTFADVTNTLDTQYNNWVTLACQLWIMWINIQKFRPNDIVTRAEFGTALSRLLYGTADWGNNYYSTHLKMLKNNWIISNTNPNLQEKRWYVMLMLMRSK